MEAGETLPQICRDVGMPTAVCVRRWAIKDEEFGKQYDAACDALYEHWAHETIEISEDGSNDWTDREVAQGRLVRTLDHEHIARSKLRIDTRRWLLSKLKREKYGEHIQQEVTGKDGAAFAAPVLNVIIDGGGTVVNGGNSTGVTAGTESPSTPEAGIGIPVRRD